LIDYFRLRAGDRIEFAASQDVAEQYPQIPREAFAQSVQLVRPDGTVASGARAVFEALGRERVYQSVPLLASVSERAYLLIARNRGVFYWVTRLTFGTRIEPAAFARTQWLFLKILAVIYGIAFASLAVQVTGLIGQRGVVPVNEFLTQATRAIGTAAYYELPGVFWLGSTDIVLRSAA